MLLLYLQIHPFQGIKTSHVLPNSNSLQLSRRFSFFLNAACRIMKSIILDLFPSTFQRKINHSVSNSVFAQNVLPPRIAQPHSLLSQFND